MTTAIRIVSPLPPEGDTPSARFGLALKVVVDVDLDEPWFEIPNLGRRLTGKFDGDNGPAAIFEMQPGASVKALVGGRTMASDTKLDDHSGSPVLSGPAAGGCEVKVKFGSFEVIYSHLKRGSTKNGLQVRAGEVIGVAGNTGRCLDGAKRHFLKISARSGPTRVRLETYSDPVTVDATLNGFSLWKPVEVPAGELFSRNVALHDVVIDGERPDTFRRGENELEVVVKRGGRPIAKRKSVITIEFQG